MSVLAILWYFVIFLLIAGYFVLDGFDLGVGILYPFICKTKQEKKIARRAIGPVWDGNEVWLLTAGGALFAAFPDAYATTFSGFYLAIMLVLFSLIVRAVSFEFYEGEPKFKGIWDATFFIGSALPALLFGVAVGNVICGIPMNANGDYIGMPLLGLINPFTLLCGVLGFVMFMAAGACWLALKAPLGSDLQKRAAGLRVPLQFGALGVFALTSVWLFVFAGAPEMNAAFAIPRVIMVCLFAGCIIAAVTVARQSQPIRENGKVIEPSVDDANRSALLAFIMQSGSAVALVFLGAFSMFPVLVMNVPNGLGNAITLMSAGSSEVSLTCMTVILCIGLPLVLIYHVLIYRTFRGRVKIEEV